MPSEESIREFQQRLLGRGWTPNPEMESLRSGESVAPIREIAHVIPMSWQQAYDEGLITFDDLSREQQEKLQADLEAQRARTAYRDHLQAECLRLYDEHAWYLNLADGYPASVGCTRCGADAPDGVEDGLTVSVPVEIHRDGERWVVSPRL